jgi:hypothetical protein
MQKSLITVATALGLMVGAMSLYAVAQPRRDLGLYLGPKPITEQQLRAHLAAAGFSDIYVTPRITFETLAAKNGVSTKFSVDAQSGTVTRMWDDDGDDD